MYRIIDLYKDLGSGEHLLPTSTGFAFWEAIYTSQSAVIDREFARRFAGFKYFDFLNAREKSEARADLKADVLSILTFNKKRYEEMYRIFLVENDDFPFIYNYDMTETTGAQHTETKYGATSETKGQETFTKGAQENTEGALTDTHSVAPMNSTTPQVESTDAKTAQTFNEGQRIDTSSTRTDTANEHTDEYDADEWTLHRQGNIGTQNAANIAEDFTAYWTEMYKFLQLIFDDIAKQLLFVGD